MAAENKRQNAGPKVPVALPKVDSPQQNSMQTVSLEAALSLVVGSRVRVNTAQPNQSSVEGIVYCADPITNLIVLNVSPAQSNGISANTLHAPSGSYRIIPISQITSFQIQSLPQPQQTSPDPSTTSASNTLDTAALETRLKRTISHLQTAQSKQGPKGTSAADQALFDALSRTMPTQWRGTSMVVSDTYLIDKPYQPGNIRFVEGANGDIDRIKKVLDMERNKILLKMSKTSIDNKLTPKKGG